MAAIDTGLCMSNNSVKSTMLATAMRPGIQCCQPKHGLSIHAGSLRDLDLSAEGMIQDTVTQCLNFNAEMSLIRRC